MLHLSFDSEEEKGGKFSCPGIIPTLLLISDTTFQLKIIKIEPIFFVFTNDKFSESFSM